MTDLDSKIVLLTFRPSATERTELDLSMAAWVAQTLVDCPDVMPDDVCTYIGLPVGSTYAQGAALIKLLLDDPAEPTS
jgi:hypothetical protein